MNNLQLAVLCGCILTGLESIAKAVGNESYTSAVSDKTGEFLTLLERLDNGVRPKTYTEIKTEIKPKGMS